MALTALNLIPPLAEQLREQAPLRDPANPDWAAIDRDTCSVLELAVIWRCTTDTAYKRVARMPESFLWEVPSRKNEGKWEKRVIIEKLPKSQQRAIRRLRRQEISSVARHPGGEVQRDDDGRLALLPAERKVVEGLWLKRHEPGPSDVLHELVRDCIRCHAAPMQQLVPGSRGRYGQFRCMNSECGLEFNYQTIRRICGKVPPEPATLARKGINAYANKHGVYRPQPAANFHRNERVFGDHHQIDILLWDERDSQHSLVRWWISAWQDKATGVVAYRLGRRANADLLSLAFRDYVKKWGLPEQAWTDNGKDYISTQFSALCQQLSVGVHHTLPSKRTGESHGKSKPIERWFGTLERDCVKKMPGWCGTHPKERPDDVLWPQIKAHEAFAARRRTDTPLLSIQQFEQRFVAWVDQGFLAIPSATADAAPKDAFMADSHPVNRVSERALDVLLMRAKTRVVLRNGVSVDGRMYWNERFFGLRGMECIVRWDPGDIGEVVVSVHEKGKADQVVIATSEAYAKWAEGDYETLRAERKRERQVNRDYIEQRHRAAEGITPYDQVLMEVQQREMPTAQAVNGTPVITPGHHLAAAIDRASRPVAVSSGAKRDVKSVFPPLKLMPDDLAPAYPSKPVFTSAWEKAEWEKEHREDIHIVMDPEDFNPPGEDEPKISTVPEDWKERWGVDD